MQSTQELIVEVLNNMSYLAPNIDRNREYNEFQRQLRRLQKIIKSTLTVNFDGIFLNLITRTAVLDLTKKQGFRHKKFY